MVALVLALAACGGSSDSMQTMLNDACEAGAANSCGVRFQEIGDADTFTLLPSGMESGTGFRLLAVWMEETGCLEDADLARIEQTRALDGMVESESGRSTWTYHPDDGLTIVCSD